MTGAGEKLRTKDYINLYNIYKRMMGGKRAIIKIKR